MLRLEIVELAHGEAERDHRGRNAEADDERRREQRSDSQKRAGGEEPGKKRPLARQRTGVRAGNAGRCRQGPFDGRRDGYHTER